MGEEKDSSVSLIEMAIEILVSFTKYHGQVGLDFLEDVVNAIIEQTSYRNEWKAEITYVEPENRIPKSGEEFLGRIPILAFVEIDTTNGREYRCIITDAEGEYIWIKTGAGRTLKLHMGMIKAYYIVEDEGLFRKALMALEDC